MRLGKMTVVVLLAGLTAACSFYRSGRQQKKTWIDATNGKYSLGIIEFDDQGWLYDRSEAAVVLERVAQEARKGGTNIVVFAHGWHHDAKCADPSLPDERCDGNLECFKKTLERLDDELQLKVYRDARQALYGSSDSRVVGIYLAWRGRALPRSADYASFWNRKAASVRVGHGDVTEVIARLGKIYRDNNTDDRYTGLVIAGHSFGGQVVYAAVADLIKHRISETISINGTEQTAVPSISGLGDLVILINPALEASVYDPIHRLTRGRHFDPEQTPILMIVSSEADWPNRLLFPFGRRLSVAGEPRGRAGQYAEKVTAIGNIREQVTHCLTVDGDEQGCRGFAPPPHHEPPAPPAPSTAPEAAANAPVSQSTSACREPLELDVNKSNAQAGVWRRETLCDPSKIRLADHLEIVGARFYPVDPNVDPHDPFLVVKTTKAVIGDHNDMFDPTFVSFIVRYVGGSQLKRLALSAHGREVRRLVCSPALTMKSQ